MAECHSKDPPLPFGSGAVTAQYTESGRVSGKKSTRQKFFIGV
ncbi:hypothetical protein J2852_005592 [Azospirillum soli]|nr:hypothetical protein [Azospirillum soli]